MNAALPRLRGRLDEIRERISQAAKRSGRALGDVVLVGVTKSVPVDVVRVVVEAGLGDLGENRVQEAEEKIQGVGHAAARWHLVGHLQRNKAGRAATLFDRIHSVDRIELAEALSKRGAAEGRTLRVLVQVHVSGEASKHGVAPGELERLLERVRELPGLCVDGLMSIGPPVERAEDARPYFVRTRELRDAAERRLGLELPHVSMGMSADYEVAIEEGSTLVRVGTALFGPRDRKD